MRGGQEGGSPKAMRHACVSERTLRCGVLASHGMRSAPSFARCFAGQRASLSSTSQFAIAERQREPAVAFSDGVPDWAHDEA